MYVSTKPLVDVFSILDIPFPVKPVGPTSPCGPGCNTKFNTGFSSVPVLVTLGVLPLVTLPIWMFGVAPTGPRIPVAPEKSVINIH